MKGGHVFVLPAGGKKIIFGMIGSEVFYEKSCVFVGFFSFAGGLPVCAGEYP